MAGNEGNDKILVTGLNFIRRLLSGDAAKDLLLSHLPYEAFEAANIKCFLYAMFQRSQMEAPVVRKKRHPSAVCSVAVCRGPKPKGISFHS